MKIIHILNTNRFSGAENVVITIIDNMKKDNEIIYVSPDGPIRKYLEENNIKYEPIKKVSIKEIRRVVKKYKPDIIHAHDFTASIVSSISVSKRIKVISHIHCNPEWIKKVNLKTVIYLLSSLRYKKILMVSNAIENEYKFRRFIIRKSEIIGNVTDIERIKKLSEENAINEEFDVIFIGRLSYSKQPQKFIELVKKLVERNSSIKACMIGDGPLKEQCEKYIEEYNLKENIEMEGFQKNPYIYLKNSKLLCMTSKYEGYGLVAVEALSFGKPVVAAKVGGIPNIVDENCGKLTNNVDEMIDEINKLLNDKKYYNKKSEEALQRIHKINNIDDYILKLEEIYNQCLEGE